MVVVMQRAMVFAVVCSMIMAAGCGSTVPIEEDAPQTVAEKDWQTRPPSAIDELRREMALRRAIEVNEELNAVLTGFESPDDLVIQLLTIDRSGCDADYAGRYDAMVDAARTYRDAVKTAGGFAPTGSLLADNINGFVEGFRRGFKRGHKNRMAGVSESSVSTGLNVAKEGIEEVETIRESAAALVERFESLDSYFELHGVTIVDE